MGLLSVSFPLLVYLKNIISPQNTSSSSIVGATNSITAFIDFNSDGDFADAGELILLSGTWNGSATNTNITIPGTAACGSTIKIRIVFEYNSTTTAAEGDCGVTSSLYGEIEDYCITLICTCFDGVQNQGETGVDCGGPCGPCGISCFDGVQNQNETGIDCGGICNVCPTCFDGIQNGTETGVDCGGSCALTCGINGANPDGTSTTCCSTAPAVNVYPTNCDQIGTSAYNLNSPHVNIATSTNVTAGCLPPGTSSGCGAYGTTGTWTHYSLAPGVSYLQLAPVSVTSFGSGNTTTYHAYFQGTSCAALNYVACQPAIDFSTGGYYFYESSVTGLNPNQDVWVYTWNSGAKDFNYIVQAVGAAPATNASCPGTTAIGEACNLGAIAATFNTPGSQGLSCPGGPWGSNENTTFYSFTPTATTASLQIGNIICNDGTNGSAQFAVWTSCAAIGTYGAGSGFLGCAVGTGTISLTGLTAGQTYYIAADGFAGNNCTWSFTGTNIALPIELVSFYATNENESVLLNWSTASEINNDYFIVERTKDGLDFEEVATVNGAGNSTSILEYEALDVRPLSGLSYYRLKQVDFDGKFKYSELVPVKNDNEIITVYPNPASDNIEVSFNTNTTEATELKVIDVATGKLVIFQEINPKKGMNVVQLNTSNLSKGLYFVTLTNSSEVLNTKFIKE